MENQKIYLIPKNLNQDFQLLGGYSIGDVAILLILFSAGMAIAYCFRSMVGVWPFVTVAVMLCKINTYTVFFWTKAALMFLYRNATQKGFYLLFEKEAG